MTVTSVGCEYSALFEAVLTRNSAMFSTEGKRSLLGPPKRGNCVEIPSKENEVAVGSWPEMVMFPPLSILAPGASAAATIGLGLLVARKFRARELRRSPDFVSE